jgi:hypothetical protein
LLAVRAGGLTPRDGERDQLLNRVAFSMRKFSTVRGSRPSSSFNVVVTVPIWPASALVSRLRRSSANYGEIPFSSSVERRSSGDTGRYLIS